MTASNLYLLILASTDSASSGVFSGSGTPIDLPQITYITFGALLGAGLTILSTRYLERVRAKELRDQKFKNLLAELEDNILMVDRYQLAGGNAKIRFANSMWDSAKGDFVALPSNLQGQVRKVYNEISKFNSIIDYDLRFGGPGTGRYDTPLEVLSREIQVLLKDSIAGLKAHLSKK